MERREQRCRRASGITALVALTSAALAMMTGESVAQTRIAIDRGAQDLAERVVAGTWDSFSTHITIRRQWVTADGAPVGPAPHASEYVWERKRSGAGWKTRVTLLSATRPVVRTRLGSTALEMSSRDIVRIEDDEDGRMPRYYMRNGEQVPVTEDALKRVATVTGLADGRTGPLADAALTAAGAREGRTVSLLPQDDPAVSDIGAIVSPRRGSAREWIGSFIMPPGRASSRMQWATKAFGRRAGWVRGYGQYVRVSGDERVELLIDEQDGVPMEANVVERSELRSHTTFRYERAVNGALVRRGLRIERAEDPLPGVSQSGNRIVTDVTYSQSELREKGGR